MMVGPHYDSAPPDVPALIAVLEAHRVRYVIIGSVAAQLYGVDAQPGDFDITPALDQKNLARLAGVLGEVDAILLQTDEVGQWELQSDGERKWVSRKATQEDLKKRVEWYPDPADVTTFDHLLHTRYGNFDVVPDLSGGYDLLMKRAKKTEVHGFEVWVAHVDELLAALTVPRRAKDVPRVRKLREIQRSLVEQGRIIGIE